MKLYNISSTSVQCPQLLSENEMENLRTIEWWFDSVLHIAVSVLGLIANLISIPVLLSKYLTNVFYRTLAFLSMFDFIFIACDVLEQIRRGYEFNTCTDVPLYQTVHIYLFPKFLRPLQSIAMMASIYTTVVIAFGRYLAVSKPMSTMVNSGTGHWSNVIAYIFPVICASIVFKLPIFFEFYTEWSYDNNCGNVSFMHQSESLSNQSNLTLGRFIELYIPLMNIVIRVG